MTEKKTRNSERSIIICTSVIARMPKLCEVHMKVNVSQHMRTASNETSV